MQLKDIAVIITGGGSGLGAATARAMAAKGAKIACLDVRKEQADAVASEIKGIARILVNCAGIGTASRTIGKNGPFPLELFKRTININLVGTFNVIRLFAERLATAEPIGE